LEERCLLDATPSPLPNPEDTVTVLAATEAMQILTQQLARGIRIFHEGGGVVPVGSFTLNGDQLNLLARGLAKLAKRDAILLERAAQEVANLSQTHGSSDATFNQAVNSFNAAVAALRSKCFTSELLGGASRGLKLELNNILNNLPH
jgi:hypothetical protein